MKIFCHKILFLAGMVMVLFSCIKLPVDLSEEDRINTYISAESVIDWIKTYGSTGNDYFVHFDKTTDGGYVCIGSTNSFGAGLNDVYLVKTDANGVIEWYKTFGGSDYDNGYYVKQTAEGRYLLIGDTRSNSLGSTDIYLVKTDAFGNTSWDKTYGGIYTDFAKFAKQTDDRGYFIIGAVGTPTIKGYYIKIDSLGDTVWTKQETGVPNEVKATNDSGYIIAATTSLIKMDQNDSIVWNIPVFALSAAQGGDNCYYALYDNAVTKVSESEDGTIFWTKEFLDSIQYFGRYITKSNDGNLIITGYRADLVADLFIAKIDQAGDLLYKIVFNDAGEGYCVSQNTDGSFIIGGTTNNLISGTYSRDALIIKTKPENNWR